MGFNFWDTRSDNEITQVLEPIVEPDRVRPYVRKVAAQTAEPEPEEQWEEPMIVGDLMPAVIYEQLLVEFQQKAKERAKW